MKNLNYNNINKHIAEVFKYHRKQNNYTQEQVAEMCDLSAKYISQLERGISGGTIETIIKLCNIYKISPNTVLEPFLEKEIFNSNNKLINDFDKLCYKDKNTVKRLIEFFLAEN